MNISLDYDNTYTRDPVYWNQFIDLSARSGHSVYCVTMRYNHQWEADEVINSIGLKIGKDNCYFTNRKNKKEFMFGKNISIDVWIDDNPFFIYTDASS